jgi:aryl-alcohol dehydrogenase-like predicted oxidoreductase
MGLSAFYPPSVSEKEGHEMLKKVIDLGCTFIDTADMYGPPGQMVSILTTYYITCEPVSGF